MTKKRFVHYEHKGADYILENPNTHLDFIEMLGDCLDEKEIVNRLNKLYDENEQLKKGMIGVIDRYIKNVDCNPPSSARTYMKIKGALLNIREDLRDLLEALE